VPGYSFPAFPGFHCRWPLPIDESIGSLFTGLSLSPAMCTKALLRNSYTGTGIPFPNVLKVSPAFAAPLAMPGRIILERPFNM
jgi:hypothetical protein